MSLSQQGQQTVLTSSKPHLVGLEVDPLSTDIVIYHLEVWNVILIEEKYLWSNTLGEY